jgi:hypothetical protein
MRSFRAAPLEPQRNPEQIEAFTHGDGPQLVLAFDLLEKSIKDWVREQLPPRCGNA